jgi:cyclophilin family peptidyl-prolyl cis-trans isomerase
VPAPPTKTGERVPQPTTGLDPARTYTVTLSTNCGSIEIELDAKRGPKTAASFAWLVERGFYDNLTFHRVVPGFVIQAGDPNGNGTGGPGYHVIEPPPASLEYTQGVVAMAKAQAEPSGSSGSQFFIVTGANANLPPHYALVGRVVAGESAVQAISQIPTKAGPDGEPSTPSRPIVIEKATLSAR